MKKLVMAMAIALAAVAAQAEEVNFYLWDLSNPATQSSVNANGYLIYSATLLQSDAVAAFDSAGASSYESTIASSAALAKKVTIESGDWWENVDVSMSEMYVLCFDKANNYMYVSPVATPVYDANFGGNICDFDAYYSSHADAMSASSGYQGAGWYATSNVPEPTSGLLMLLGVAGLALKRKRA